MQERHSRLSLSSGSPQISRNYGSPSIEAFMPANSEFSFKQQNSTPGRHNLPDPYTISPLQWAIDDDRDFKMPFISLRQFDATEQLEALASARKPSLESEIQHSPQNGLLSDILQEEDINTEQRHSRSHARCAEHLSLHNKLLTNNGWSLRQ